MAWKKTPFERFSEKYYIAESGCWQWTAAKNSGGYGHFNLSDGPIHAHRASWLLHKGGIPLNTQINHHCDNRLCVNPDHLFLGSQLDNMRDMVGKGRHWAVGYGGLPQCKYGHAMTKENTYMHSGRHHCKECKKRRAAQRVRDRPTYWRDYMRDYRARKKAGA